MAAQCLLSIYYNADPEKNKVLPKQNAVFRPCILCTGNGSAFDYTGRILIRIHHGTAACGFSEIPH